MTLMIESTRLERLRDARNRLSTAQKSKVGVSAYLRYVNRPAGGRLAAIAYALGLTPTQVTVLSALCSLGGFVVAATQSPSIAVALITAALLLLGFALDSADGQLARLRGGGTKSGEWLDHVVDLPKVASLHLVVLIELARFRNFDSRSPYLLIPLAFLLISITLFFAMQLRDQLLRGPKPAPAPTASPGRPGAEGSVLRSIALLPIDYGVLCLVFVLMWSETAFLTVYTVIFVITLLFAIYSLRKAYRGLSATDRSGER
jgi:phosphatidylglycerophosphate synthase